MKICVIGGSGTIGRAVVSLLSKEHEVFSVSKTQGPVTVDLTNPDSIASLYQKLPALDAIIVASGKVFFKPLAEISYADYQYGLTQKLMGAVELVRQGVAHLNDGGSFTLTSGILNRDPIVTGSSAAIVNGALDAFVKAAAIEMPRNLRINIVSPTILEESMPLYANYFKGYVPVPAKKVALAYQKSVEGAQTGQCYWVA